MSTQPSDPLISKPETGIPFSKIRCSDCIIFGKPISSPAPCYPIAAKAARVAGEIKVHLVVDEEGKVIWAKAESGHPFSHSALKKQISSGVVLLSVSGEVMIGLLGRCAWVKATLPISKGAFRFNGAFGNDFVLGVTISIVKVHFL